MKIALVNRPKKALRRVALSSIIPLVEGAKGSEGRTLTPGTWKSVGDSPNLRGTW